MSRLLSYPDQLPYDASIDDAPIPLNNAPYIFISPRRRLRGVRSTLGSFFLSVAVHTTVFLALAASTAFVAHYNGHDILAEVRFTPPTQQIELTPTFRDMPKTAAIAYKANPYR